MSEYKYDTHAHTSETSPCGRVPAAELVQQYKAAGYSGVVITDHYFGDFFRRMLFRSWPKKIGTYLKGYKNALVEASKLDFDIILGMEIRFDENVNDYLVYGIDEDFLLNYKKLYRLGLAKFKKLAVEKGLLVVQAHPFRSYLDRADPSLLDGVEVYNGNPRHDSKNDLARGFAQENGLFATSGSDFHQPQDLARGGIILSERLHTSQDLVKILRQGSVLSLIKNT